MAYDNLLVTYLASKESDALHTTGSYMKAVLKDLTHKYRQLDRNLTEDTPLIIYSDGTGAAIVGALTLGALCIGTSSCIMYIGCYLCTQGQPSIPIYLLGLVFSTLFTIGIMTTAVMLFAAALVLGGYALYQMALIPLTLGTWGVSMLLGNTKRR